MDVVTLTGVVKRFDRRYGASTAQQHHGGGREATVDVALAGVDLAVEAGEAVAVLGSRRSGRSTLLSVMRGVFRADEGTVRVRGRVGGLVGMSAGFSPTASLAHNITLNGMLLGMTRERVTELTSEFLDEAGVTEAMLSFPLRDLPAPRRQRLAYSLAMHSDPDIFQADKTVVTGDKAFRESGLAGIEAHRDAGRAVLLATNDGGIVRRVCTRGIVLRAGRIVYDGRPRKALQFHRETPAP